MLTPEELVTVKQFGKECILENIQRIKDAIDLIETSRAWLDGISDHDCGDMSLRFKQYEGLLIIDYCILERELDAEEA